MSKSGCRIVVRTIAALSVVAAVAACSTTKQVSDVTPAQGFLPQPDLLQPGKSGQATLVYFAPNADFTAYKQVMLDPVTIWTAPGSSLESLPPDKRQDLANGFHLDLFGEISKRCRMVDQPLPATLRVRVALVDAEQSAPALNTVATYIPQARLLSTLGAYAFNDGVGVFTGSATAEGYATDATSGAVLWQGVDKRAGGNAIGTNTLNSWSDVDNAFTAWAQLFAKRLEELGACHA